MGNINLTPSDEAVLEVLAEGASGGDRLVDAADYDGPELEERLGEMVDNGLVRETESGVYELTDSGHRVLASPADGSADSRVDAPAHVERAVEELGLRADREEALVEAFAFLRYWGEATADEVIDAVYGENPTGYESDDEWWTSFLRDQLASLPDVVPPSDGDGVWSYAGRPGVADETADGRMGFTVDADATYGSVKHALEEIDLTPELRAAARTAFSVLRERGEARADELVADVDRPPAYETETEFWETGLRPVFEALPNVEPADDGEGTWRYAKGVGGRGAAGTRLGGDEPAERPQRDRRAESTAGSATGDEDACPVCHAEYAGRVFLRTSETVLPARSNRTCVRATPDEHVDAALTLYYHQRDP